MSALADLYHFRDLTKMIRHLYATGFSRLHCASDGFIKSFPLLTTEQRHQFTGKPILHSRKLDKIIQRLSSNHKEADRSSAGFLQLFFTLQPLNT